MIQDIGKTRCAACGSNRVMYDTKKEGYSIAKGILGTAILGTAGALVGTDGKKTRYYHCPTCGVTLSYAMPDTTSLYIDKLLLDPEHNKDMLRFYKQQYPNIEWEEKAHNISTFDKRIREGNKNDMPKLFYATYGLKEEQNFDELLRERVIKWFGLSESNYQMYDMLFEAEDLEEQGYATLRTNGKNLFIKFYGYEPDDYRKNGILDNNKADCARRRVNDDCAMRSANKESPSQRKKILEERINAILSKKNHLSIVDIGREIEKFPLEPDFFDKYTLAYYDALHSPSNQIISAICKNGCEKGIYEVEIDKRREYYSLYGTKERLEKEKEEEIRQYNEQAEKFNADLDKQIHTLNEERAVQLKIYEENSKKIFGKGAKAKRTAQKAIFDIDEKIKTLNATRKKLKK